MTLNGISAYQRGLFTTAQAKKRVVERYVLSRLEKVGTIERLAKGVYRMGGAPSLREEEVIDAWLSLNPDKEPGAKVGSEDKIIVTGVTSAWLRQLGEVGPAPLEFCRSRRKQTQRDGLTVKKRSRVPSGAVRRRRRVGRRAASSTCRTSRPSGRI